MLSDRPCVRDCTRQSGRYAAHEGAAAADVFGDEKRLALQLETVCVERLAKEPVSVHVQQVSWRRINGTREDVKQQSLRLAIHRPNIHTTSIAVANDGVQEMKAVRQKRWIPMRVLVEGRIDHRHRRDCSALRIHRNYALPAATQKNGLSCTPRGTADVVHGLDDFYGSAGGGNLPERSVGEEANPAIVRGPERILAVLGSGELPRVHLIQRSQPEHGSGARHRRTEHQRMAVG